MAATTRAELPTIPPPGTVALTDGEAMAHLGIRARALRNHVARGAVTKIVDAATGEHRYCVPAATLAARGVHAGAGAAAPGATLRTTEAVIAGAVERAVAGALAPLVAGLADERRATSRLTDAFEATTAGHNQAALGSAALARDLVDREQRAQDALTKVRQDARTLARQVQALEQRWGDPAAVRARLAELAPAPPPRGPLARLLGDERD